MSYPDSCRQCGNCRSWKDPEKHRVPYTFIWGLCAISGADVPPSHSCSQWRGWGAGGAQEEKEEK